jgi:hypothetical protein
MWVGGEATLGVCAGNGDYYKIAGKGQSELLFVGDVEGDGRDEIFFGANTCCQNFLSIAVIDDGDLREVARPSGRPFVLKQRFSDPGNRHSSERDFGCQDLDRDGVVDVVQVEVRREGRSLMWTKTAYAIRGGIAIFEGRRSGSTARPFRGSADELLSDCELRQE